MPADGFYEWKRLGKTKQPYCFEINEGGLFAFAGIWDRWRDAGGNVVDTCSILPTTPNAIAVQVHDRMPVIIEPDAYDLWLDPGMQSVTALADLLRPCDARSMRSCTVSPRVNNVANDDQECSLAVAPAAATASQSSLFS